MKVESGKFENRRNWKIEIGKWESKRLRKRRRFYLGREFDICGICVRFGHWLAFFAEPSEVESNCLVHIFFDLDAVRSRRYAAG